MMINLDSKYLLRLAETHAAVLPSSIIGLSEDERDTAVDHAIQAIILWGRKGSGLD